MMLPELRKITFILTINELGHIIDRPRSWWLMLCFTSRFQFSPEKSMQLHESELIVVHTIGELEDPDPQFFLEKKCPECAKSQIVLLASQRYGNESVI